MLNGLDLVVPAGTTQALVGASGCGKTTVLALLLGLYEIEGGKITLDGQVLPAPSSMRGRQPSTACPLVLTASLPFHGAQDLGALDHLWLRQKCVCQ